MAEMIQELVMVRNGLLGLLYVYLSRDDLWL